MGDQSYQAYRDDRSRVIARTAIRDGQTQKRHIDTVSSRIATAIIDFLRVIDGQNFYADDLRKFVTQRTGQLAPGSADRIMRNLRQRGLIAYRVVNRAQSLYRAGQE